MVTIGNASAFWGDTPTAAYDLVSAVPELDFLTFDYLAELSLSIMAVQRDKDATKGYATDFIDAVELLVPLWRSGAHVKLIANAGGLNPEGCRSALLQMQHKHGLDKKIAVCGDDDVLSVLLSDPQNPLYNNMDSGAALTTVADKLIAANAYRGGGAIAQALVGGADIVITGRVADPSLTVGACLASFGWHSSDYDKLAQATIAGHIIECGCQATGGIATCWDSLPHIDNIAFPVVEMADDGSFAVTKPRGSGGAVTLRTVKEQLLYEIGDPGSYISPDVTVSILALELQQESDNRVIVKNAKGREPTPYYKVSASYRAGYKAEGFIVLVGGDLRAKAHKCVLLIKNRLAKRGIYPANIHMECLGLGDATTVTAIADGPECVLRIAVHDDDKSVVDAFTKEIAPLVTAGPQGTTGYSGGRPSVRPRFGFWPCLVDKAVASYTR